MNRALLFLVFLSFRARYRRIGRGLRTVRGLLLMLVGFGFFALIVLGSLLAGSGPREAFPDMAGGSPGLSRFGPAGLLAFTLLSLFASSKHRGIYFSPAETDFLFPAPFTRRELLGYRLSTQLVYTLLSVLFTSALVFRYLSGFWQTVVGLFLTFTFLNCIQMAGSLVSGTLEERVVARGRRFVFLSLLALLVLTFAASSAALQGGAEFREGLRDVLGSPALGWALLPLKAFAETLAARDLSGFLLWGSAAAAVDAVMIWLILRLDLDYTEASLEASRKIHLRLERLKNAGRVGASSRKLRLPLPMPPRLGGLGPVAWRQGQEMLRDMPGAVYLLAVFAGGAFLPYLLFTGEGEETAAALGWPQFGLVASLPFILSNWFRFDFRGDLERIELLLGLPLAPGVMALGQLLVPALLLSLLQAGGLVLLWTLGIPGGPAGDEAVLLGLLFCAPFNLLFVAIENLLFLLYPVRVGAAAPGDFQTLGRLMVAMALKLLALGVVGLLGFLIGLGVYSLSGRSQAAAVSAAFGFLVLAALLGARMVGWAFSRFDVTRAAAE